MWGKVFPYFKTKHYVKTPFKVQGSREVMTQKKVLRDQKILFRNFYSINSENISDTRIESSAEPSPSAAADIKNTIKFKHTKGDSKSSDGSPKRVQISCVMVINCRAAFVHLFLAVAIQQCVLATRHFFSK